jgi:hypothetical protein
MRAAVLVCTALATLVAAGCGSGGTTERSLDDPPGDVPAGTSPDIVAVAVERDDETITFRVRFADAPPLDVSEEDGWIDMLLIGIDVPPLGSPPVAPGGEWSGADFFLGTHGPFEDGMLVRTAAGKIPPVELMRTDIPLVTDGATLSLLVPRSALGDPETFSISVAAAREWNEAGDEPAGAKPDIAPDTGTWTVDLASR